MHKKQLSKQKVEFTLRTKQISEKLYLCYYICMSIIKYYIKHYLDKKNVCLRIRKRKKYNLFYFII